MDLRRNARIVFNALFDAILPRRERRVRTENRTIEDIPLSPVIHTLLGVQITTLAKYQAAAVEDMIQTLKYDRSMYAASLAAGLIADYLREEIASSKIFSQKKILLVPMPLHESRLRERGYNQIEFVLSALPKEFKNGPLSYMAVDLLVRSRETKPQTRLPRSERLSNVAGAFALSAGAPDMKKTHIFLMDDVTTTGATLANAAQPLRRAGAKVTLLALARA